jgi:hypothetical protein
MADPKKPGLLAGVLEREKTPPKPVVAEPEPDEAEPVDAAPAKGRGGSAPAKPRVAAALKKTKPRTIHLPDDLFERILVQAHRRDKTISEYVAALLDRHVPDHRVVRATSTEEEAA